MPRINKNVCTGGATQGLLLDKVPIVQLVCAHFED